MSAPIKTQLTRTKRGLPLMQGEGLPFLIWQGPCQSIFPGFKTNIHQNKQTRFLVNQNQILCGHLLLNTPTQQAEKAQEQHIMAGAQDRRSTKALLPEGLLKPFKLSCSEQQARFPATARGTHSTETELLIETPHNTPHEVYTTPQQARNK